MEHVEGDQWRRDVLHLPPPGSDGKTDPEKKKKTLADMKKNKNLLSLRTCGSVGAISALYSCTGVTSALLE